MSENLDMAIHPVGELFAPTLNEEFYTLELSLDIFALLARRI